MMLSTLSGVERVATGAGEPPTRWVLAKHDERVVSCDEAMTGGGEFATREAKVRVALCRGQSREPTRSRLGYNAGGGWGAIGRRCRSRETYTLQGGPTDFAEREGSTMDGLKIGSKVAIYPC